MLRLRWALFTTHSDSNELVMENDPREKIYQCYRASEKRHDNSYIQGAKCINQEVVCKHPHQTEERTSAQELSRSHSLSHQVVDTFTACEMGEREEREKRQKERERERSEKNVS